MRIMAAFRERTQTPFAPLAGTGVLGIHPVLWLCIATALLGLGIMVASYHPVWRKNGYLPGLASALSFLLMNNLIRIADNELGVPFGACLLVRTACLSAGSLLLGKVGKEQITYLPTETELRHRVALRALMGVICTFSLFIAFSFAPVLQCLSVFYSNSIFSSIMGYVFLKETLGYDEMMVMFIGLSAVLVILRGSSFESSSVQVGDWRALGLGFAALAAVAEAVAGVANRSINGRVHYLTLTFAQAFLGFVFCLGFASQFPDYFDAWPFSAPQIQALVGVTVSSFLVQVTVNQAYMLEKTGPLQVFMNAMVVLPQLLVDACLGFQHNASTWFGLAMLVGYLHLSWRVVQRRAAEVKS